MKSLNFQGFQIRDRETLGKVIKLVKSDRSDEYYGRHTEMG